MMEVGPTTTGGGTIHCTFCGKRVESITSTCSCRLQGSSGSKSSDNGSIYNSRQFPVQEKVKAEVIRKFRNIFEHDVKEVVDSAVRNALDEVRDRLTVILVSKDAETFSVKFEWKTDGPNDKATR